MGEDIVFPNKYPYLLHLPTKCTLQEVKCNSGREDLGFGNNCSSLIITFTLVPHHLWPTNISRTLMINQVFW